MKKKDQNKMEKPGADFILSKPDHDPHGKIFYHPVLPKYALTGAVAGGVILGIVAWLLASGIIAVEGLGQIAAGGKDAAVFLGFISGSALGGLVGGILAIYFMSRNKGKI
jgi:hypothetical protein